MSDKILKQQKLKSMGLLVLVGFSCVCLFMIYLNTGSSEKVVSKKATKLPSEKVSEVEVLLSRIESQNELMQSKIAFMEKSLVSSKKSLEESKIEREKEKQLLQKQISTLKKCILDQNQKNQKLHPMEHPDNGKIGSIVAAHIDSKADTYSPTPSKSYFNSEEEDDLEEDGGLLFIEVDNLKPRKKVKKVNAYIPAGTTVRALLVSSVDVVCHVNSSVDPQPVKLRILDDAKLPKQVRAKLKGGLVIASAYGDLSSERVYFRPERLTQIKRNGEFVETEIAGFISGEDGKNGLRGIVVDKSSKIVGHAAVSGLFAGASQYLQAVIRAKYCGYGGYPGCNNDNGNYLPYGMDVATEGVTSGATSGFDILTKYYIERAEQVRPVIEVAAGRIVDLTFTYGSELGELYTKNEIEAVRESSRSEEKRRGIQ